MLKVNIELDWGFIIIEVLKLSWGLEWVDFSPVIVPDTEDASETDLAKHDEDDYVEIKEQ